MNLMKGRDLGGSRLTCWTFLITELYKFAMRCKKDAAKKLYLDIQKKICKCFQFSVKSLNFLPICHALVYCSKEHAKQNLNMLSERTLA